MRSGRGVREKPVSGTAFQCNLCGTQNILEPAHLHDPELASCSRCGSNVRIRWLAHRLSRELFGRSLPLCEFPRERSFTGLGLTDPEIVAERLAECFTYRNTYFHREPRFDIRSHDSPLGALDFLIASEVFEHIEPPVAPAFRNAFRLLKPSGVFLLTVPWVWDGDGGQEMPELHDWKLVREAGGWAIVNRNPTGAVERFADPVFDGGPGPCLGNTREHFPGLFEWKLAEENGAWNLTNKRRDGTAQRFENVVFHGGPGLVLEMRLFTRGGLGRELSAAGFRSIEFEIEECPAYGIVFPYPWSRPIVARR
jgi:SAM-dependent methyltransferase